MLAELSRAGWSFSRLHFHLWGLRCYFLLPGVPSSLRWAGCQMVPLLAATGSQCNCEVILLLQGLLRPVDQGFFRSVRPTPFNALPKKDFSPSCTDSPQCLGQTALGAGMEMLKGTSSSQLKASGVWRCYLATTLQSDAHLPKLEVKRRGTGLDSIKSLWASGI